MLQTLKQNKKLVLSIMWSVVVVSWLVLGSIFFLGDDETIGIIALTAAAVITEVAFWITALLFGMAMVDARKMLWHKLTGRSASQA
ncbi:hypothetical protein AB8S08_05150 [Pseudidiomarina sp. PP-1MA]|uniref:Transporter suffix domain-containing protein n=1 Tax=Pseudidiomarina sp. PP-1MA TaxID=3237706 RepID=A0AB39X9Q5_9GAMM